MPDDEFRIDPRDPLGVTSGRHTQHPPTALPFSAGASATAEECAAALRLTGYTCTDPVTDPAHPGITSAEDVPDAFPRLWGMTGPTEREQSVITAAAGNAL